MRIVEYIKFINKLPMFVFFRIIPISLTIKLLIITINNLIINNN